jgi:transcriptional regulator with XRE-family HTH domain
VTGSTRSPAKGVIAGAVLAAARHTAGLTQEDFAEATGVALDTVKRWENGQRPLGRVRAADLSRIQRQLRMLGGRPVLLGRLHAAIDADEFIAQAAAGDCNLLAAEVTTRPWSSLVAWALTGEPPAEARNTAQRRPLLGAGERHAIFTSIREAATISPTGDRGSLLRHQAYYLAAMDTSPEGAAWLRDAARAESSRLQLTGKWSPSWAVTRSLVVATACQGDPGPLRWFIGNHLADHVCDEANLSYWAYWTGADSEPAAAEEFMIERRLDVHRAGVLLHHLAVNLTATLPYAELSVESARSVLRRWPGLLRRDSQTAVTLADRTAQILDSGQLPAHARPALSDLHITARDAA